MQVVRNPLQSGEASINDVDPYGLGLLYVRRPLTTSLPNLPAIQQFIVFNLFILVRFNLVLEGCWTRGSSEHVPFPRSERCESRLGG